MAKQSAVIYDQLGGRWLVLPEDPAWPAVKHLLTRMDIIVLPLSLVVKGEAEVDWEHEQHDTTLDNLREAVESGVGAAATSAFIRRLRYLLCLKELEASGILGSE